MKNKQIKWLCLLLLTGVFLGCEQEHPEQQDGLNNKIVNKFFEYQSLKSNQHSSKVTFTSLSINELRAYNEKVNFIPNFVTELGFADWNNARYFEVNNETVLQVPVYSDGDTEVRALIIAVQNEDNFYSYVIRRNAFENFFYSESPTLTLAKVIDLFILADYKIFGTSSYLPFGKVSFKNKQTSNSVLKGSIIAVETCYYMEVYNSDWTLLDARWECETDYHYLSHFTAVGEDEGGGGGFDGYTGGGGGGGPRPAPTPAPVPAPDIPIDNIEEYFECLDLNMEATLVIYVDQPIANSDQVVSYTGNVGHTFVGLIQGGNTSIFGFYPENSGKPGSTDNGALGNDASNPFDVSILINISPSQLNAIMNYIRNNNNGYDLDNYNCTDFAIEIAALAGLNLPDTFASWGIGGGSNPASLGQDIRNMNLGDGVNRIITGGNAPANSRTCDE